MSTIVHGGGGGGGKVKTYLLLRCLNKGMSLTADTTDDCVWHGDTAYDNASERNPILMSPAFVQSGVVPNTQTFNFTKPQEVTGFRWRNAHNYAFYLVGYTVSYSDDGSTYTTAGTRSGIPYVSNSQISNYEFESVGKHKYWKVVINGNQSPIQWNFFDLIGYTEGE